MGELKVSGGSYSLSLIRHDCLTGGVAGIQNIQKSVHDPLGMVVDVIKAVNTLSGQDFLARTPAEETMGFTTSAAIALGRSFRLMKLNDIPFAMDSMRKINSYGTKMGNRMITEEFLPSLQVKKSSYAKAMEAEYLGAQNAGATDKYEQFLSGKPKDFHHIMQLANIKMQAGLLKEAKKLALLAQKVNGQHPKSYIFLARIYQKEKKIRKAMAQMSSAERMGALDPDFYVMKAELLSTQKQKDGSAQAYHRAGELYQRYGDLSPANTIFLSHGP